MWAGGPADRARGPGKMVSECQEHLGGTEIQETKGLKRKAQATLHSQGTEPGSESTNITFDKHQREMAKTDFVLEKKKKS